MSIKNIIHGACCWVVFLGSAVAHQSSSPTFSKFATIAISHTRAGSSDLLNFPLLISGTYPQLRSTANGGYVTSPNGYDIVFGTDSACANRLSWETEYWDSTGRAAYWVNIPVLSHTNDNLIYLCAGSSNITTNQSSQTATWNSNYVGVWHFPNGQTLSGADSTSNGNNWSNVVEAAGNGVIDGDAVFSGAQSSTIAYNSSLQNQAFSIEMWLYLPSLPSAYTVIFQKGNPWFIIMNQVNQIGLGINGNYYAATDYLMTAGWTHLVWTYDGVGTIYCYANGNLVNTRTNAGTMSLDASGLLIGQNQTGGQYLNGQIDELRLSATTLPANRIAASYANESSPSSFYSLNFPIPGAIAKGSPILW
jgi:hypothetical protein